MTAPSVSVIIVTRNNLGATQLCLSQLRRYLPEGCELIAVDNGSTDGTVAWLMQQRGVRLLRNAANVGLAAAWNQALAKARGDFLWLMHNDVVITRDTFAALRDALLRDDRLGMVAPYTYRCSPANQSVSEPGYHTLGELQPFADKIAATNPPLALTVLAPNVCLMLRRRAWESVGNFDERYALPSFEAWDYALRLERAGGFVALVNNYVHHEPGSFAVNGLDRGQVVDVEQEALFREAYGVNPAYYSLARTDMVQYIDFARDDCALLELGCGAGGTLMQLRFDHPRFRLHGVELDEHVAALARSFADDVRVVNLEAWDVPEEWRGAFDCVLAGDVIEHLRDTGRIMRQIHAMLKPGGRLIASIPNVQHISVLRGLLGGHWDYTAAGILDRTHLRFFTADSVIAMIVKAGLAIDFVRPNIIGLAEEEERLLDWLTSANSPVRTPRILFEAYQWLFRAVKR